MVQTALAAARQDGEEVATISTQYLHNIYALSTQVGGPGDPEVPGEELRHDHEEDRAARRD